MQKTKLVLTLLFTCAAVCTLISGCSKNELTNVEYGNQNQILFVANADEPQALDPHITTGEPDFHVISSLFEGLTRLNGETLAPEPATAASWVISDDKLTYTFTLRDNAAWSNGQPVTAEDFVWSWRRALTPALGNLYAYMMYYVKNAEAYNTGEITDFDLVGIHALDAKTLEVTLASPTPFFLQLLDHHSYYPLPRATIEKHGDFDSRVSSWTLPENIVSNGAFKLSSWEINKLIAVDKNPHYWNAEHIKLEGVRFLPINDKQAEERAFRSGQVHLTYSPQMAIEKIATYKKEAPELLRVTQTYSNYYYLINHTRKPFDDVRVRKALAYSIDRTSLVENILKGGEVPAYTFVPADKQGHKPVAHFSENVALAKQLLAEAGFPNGEGFPSFEILYNTDDNHRKVALAIQQMWRQNLGIEANLLNQEWKVYLDSQTSLNFDVARRGWVADYLDPSNFYELLLSYGGNSNTGWVNTAYDKVVEDARLESDHLKRMALFEQANKIIADEMPVIPIYFMTDLNLVRSNVKNWHDNVMHRHHFNDVYLETEAN